MFLFSHAGVTKTWLKKNVHPDQSLEVGINELLYTSPEAFAFTIGENSSPFGDDITQSPIWVRPTSLLRDRISGYIQVVGHTIQDRIIPSDDVVFIDTLGTSGEYLILRDKHIQIEKF